MIIEGATTPWAFLLAKWPRILAAVLIVVAVELAYDWFNFARPVFSYAAAGIVATALSIFIVFRVNESYARWWEARTLWGGIVNSSRSLARQATTLVVPRSDDASERAEVDGLRRELVHRQIAWVNALRLALRREEEWEQLEPFVEASELERLRRLANKPAQLLQTQSERIAEALRDGRLSEFGRLMLDGTLATLLDYQGGCERIKNTAFPDRVSFFNQILAWGVAILIPLSVIKPDHRFDWVEVLVVPLMMLAFIITERLGSELRNPFEGRPNDTPMTAICRTIEIDLRQQLGEEDVPPPIEAVDGVLM
jgi:putative membrane protein